MNTGRYWIRDWKSGRTFCVEPLEMRHEKQIELQPSETVVRDNKKHKGTVAEKDSIITTERGFVNITETLNPLDVIESLLK